MAYGANESHLLSLQIALMVRHFHVPHVYLVTHFIINLRLGNILACKSSHH